MEGEFLWIFLSLIFKKNGKLRIQIGSLVETAFYLVLLKARLIKYGIIREKIDGSAGFPGLSYYRQQPSISSVVGFPLS